jgi:dephospho-CoA kinase
MKKVGITGGIGSGKSYICRQFGLNFGIITYYSDIRGRILMEKNSELRNLIINEFGKDSYLFENEHFNLNRDKFIKLLFDNESARKKMNSFVHPFVRKEFLEWCDLIDDYYTLFESAILFDNEDRLKTDMNYHYTKDVVVSRFFNLSFLTFPLVFSQ